MARRTLIGLLLALVAVASVVVQVEDAHRSTRLEDLKPFRRVWTDLSSAITRLLDYRHPVDSVPPRDPTDTFKDVLLDRDQLRNLEVSHPWITLRPRAFLPFRGRVEESALDDPGRARLLFWMFRFLDGIAPYAIFWLAPLFFAPAAVHAFVSLARSRLWSVGLILLAWFICAPFVGETLALPRNTVGFYLVAVVALVGSSIRSVFGPPERLSALLIRAAVTGLFVSVLMTCRSSVAFCLPGFLIQFAVAAWRSPAAPGARVGLRFMLSVGLFLTPIALTRESRHHDVWLAAWEGLGDFDRTYDHTWSDDVAKKYVTDRGAPSLRSAATEEILREVILRRIASDPLWFGQILVKRAASTLSLWKLWPYGPADGEFIRRSTSANEGAIDKYFTYTTTVDHFGPPSNPTEVRVAFLIAPLFVYLAGTVVFRRRWDLNGPLVLICVAAGVLGLPVLMTTAGGQETQCAFVLHVLGAGFLLSEVVAAVRPYALRVPPANGTPLAQPRPPA